MAGGYVLGFSNQTFEDFFHEVVGVPIYNSRYDLGSGSKANRMRAFWRVATDEQLKTLLRGLLDGWNLYSDSKIPDSAEKLINDILARLKDADAPQEPKSAQPETPRLNDLIADDLHSKLLELSSLTPQNRGYAFERFLKNLFDAYGLAARASFRITGEQIDGSFVMHNETYLLEAKWQNAPSGVADLHTFEGKLREKAYWSRGLFVSNSGFSPEGLQAFGTGKRTVCMDGLDLSEMLRSRLSFVDVLSAKVRKAAETGSPFTSIRNMSF